MKGKELIEFIQKNELENFDLTFNFVDGFSTFPNHRKFEITEVEDIGYSSKIIALGGEEK